MILCHENGLMTLKFVKFAAALILTVSTSLCATAANDEALAVFAGGCFWCVESDFDHVLRVTETILATQVVP